MNTNYAYDNLSRLLSVLHQSASTTLDGASYTYDNAGNRVSKTNYLNNVTEGYSYDPLYQLTQVTQGASTTESYSYDSVGNRLSSLGMPSYSYNAANELTSTTSGSYTYDYNGNAVTKNDSTGVTAYAWDFENRLTSVTLPGSSGTVSFQYDPFGRRIYKSSSSGTSVYTYEGDNLVEEMNSAGMVVARYSQGLNIDEPLAMLRAGATSFHNADGLGSATSLTDAVGALTQTYTFDSFGKQTASSGPLTNPFQYTGREFDDETGLYYYRARYYDQMLGRFVSEDPTEMNGGIDFYTYVGNRPIVATDPTGLKTAGIGGTVINLSKCCVLVSGNPDPNSPQKQYYIPPGKSSGPFADVDAIYFHNGSALKIPDSYIMVVLDCFGDVAPKNIHLSPVDRFLKSIYPRLAPKFLPDRGAIENEFHQIEPPVPCGKCQ